MVKEKTQSKEQISSPPPHPVIEEIIGLARARTPLIYVLTHEEERFIIQLEEGLERERDRIAKKDKEKTIGTQGLNGRQLFVWSSVRGIRSFDEWAQPLKAPNKDFKGSENLSAGLSMIASSVIPPTYLSSIYVMCDMNSLIHQGIPRQIRDILSVLPMHKDPNGNQIGPKTLIIVAPQLAYGPGLTKSGIEPTLDKYIKVLDFNLPTKEEIYCVAHNMIASAKTVERCPQSILDITGENIEQYSRALQGLTEHEVRNAISTSLSLEKGTISIERLIAEKKQIIKKSDVLEFVDHQPSFDDVGGLDEAKKYFEFYNDQFSEEAKAFGLQPLRGVIITGVPGVGKSLIAKAVAKLWKLPLIRFDVGRVLHGIVGSSEARVREAVNQLQSMSPAVCWTDEIEKALSGTKSSDRSDAGTLSRVFGTLLTAMEEGLKDVVMIATSNSIESIPPEMIRRFNEVFFVDLPMPPEREEIFRIHLNKRGRSTDRLSMKKLVDASHMYTGSEIEKAVQEGIARSWRDGKRALKTVDLLGALQDTKPISRVMEEQISKTRAWARDRARYASSLAAAASGPGQQVVSTSSGKELRVDDALDDLGDISLEPKEVKQTSIIEDLLSTEDLKN